MLLSGLMTTRMDAEAYWREQFTADVMSVTSGVPDHVRVGDRFARLPISSFLQQEFGEPYSGVAARFQALLEQRWFLASLFVSQMAAQTFPGEYYKGPPAVLVGLLPSYWQIMHPGYLLLVLGSYREAVRSVGTGSGLVAILDAQVAELTSWRPWAGARLREEVSRELGEGVIRDDLRPFQSEAWYKYTFDRDAVSLWRSLLREERPSAPEAQGELFRRPG